MKCPGSVRLSAGLPNLSSVHAQEGTRAHALAELALTKNFHPLAWLGETLEGGEITDEMVDHVTTFVDYCRSRPGVMSWVERRFNLAAFEPPAPMFGTADFVSYDWQTKTLEVVDLKYGAGVVVEVIDNPQLRYYGLGAVLSLEGEVQIDRVIITIVQPRAAHSDGPIRSETIDYIDLIGWSSALLAAARATTEPDAKLVAGDHCRWCPARAQCPERAEHALAVAQQEFSVTTAPAPFTPPAPELIPDAQFYAMLAQLDTLDDWMKAMRARGEYELQQGREVPGFKLVARRATRKWIDEQETIARLHAQGFERDDIGDWELKSPAQIEKLLGKKPFTNTMADTVIKQSSGLTMVPESDARPAVNILTAGDEFGILPASTNTPQDGRE